MSAAMTLKGRLLVARADASAESGTGHLMRLLALGQAWSAEGGRIRWLTAGAPDRLIARIGAEGILVDRLAIDAGSARDAETVCRRLSDDPSAIGVIDGDGFGVAYLHSLGPVSGRVLLVDDTAALPSYPIGYLLNQNLHARRGDYPAAADCRFLLGARYVLLRREFVAEPPPRTIPTTARHVLITFGGADPSGMTSRTIDALRRLPPAVRRSISVRIIVGSASRSARPIESALAGLNFGDRAHILHDVADMPTQMAWADLAVASGGSTVWEMARMGCPALVVETAPAEKRLVAGLTSAGLFTSLGPAATLAPQAIADAIAAKVEDAAWRERMSRLGMSLVDGDGARRVVAALTEEAVVREGAR